MNNKQTIRTSSNVSKLVIGRLNDLTNDVNVIASLIKEKAEVFSSVKDVGSLMRLKLDVGLKDNVYTFDPLVLIANATHLLELLEEDKGIFVSDLVTLPSPFQAAKSLEPEVPILFHHDSAHWPVNDTNHGVVCVMGEMYAGKTYYIQTKSRAGYVIRLGEPGEAVDPAVNTIPAVSTLNALNIALTLSTLGERVAIDSLRKLMYNLRGPAMEGGVVGTLYDVLTSLNNVCYNMGVTVMVAVNPMLADRTKADRVFNRIASATVGAVHLIDGEVASETYRLTTGRVMSSDSHPGNSVKDSSDEGVRLDRHGRPMTGHYIKIDDLDEHGPRDEISFQYSSPSGDDDYQDGDDDLSRSISSFSL